MKTFDVYRHSENGKTQVVKRGFSWPAFFFGFFWCFAKGMVGWGIALAVISLSLAAGMVALAIYSNSFEGVSALSDLVSLGFALYVGWAGNEWRAATLSRKNYVKRGSVEADSASQALAKAQA